jgi:hypothetical protein
MSGIRNLTDTVQFKVFIPDITAEEAQRNVPWVMRLKLPTASAFLEVMEIDHPFFNLGSMLGPSPKKTVGYGFRVPVLKGPNPFVTSWFITSVFAGVDVPWPAETPKGLGTRWEKGMLVCQYLGATSHTGILLVHIATRIYNDGAPDYDLLADELEEELKSVYLVVRPREYELDKRLLQLAQAASRADESAPKEKSDG